MRMKKVPAKPPLAEKYPVPDGEARGADDRPISRGNVVRRIPYAGVMKVEVPTRIGRVVDIFRRSETGPVIVTFRGSDRDGQGLYSGHAANIKRSAAAVEITEVPDEEA